MKSEIIKPAEVFVPISITLTIETQDELDKLRALFNSSQIRFYLKNTDGLVSTLDDAGAHHNRYLDYVQYCLKYKGNI